MTSDVKYPDIEVHLSTGTDGNAGVVYAKVAKALRRAGVEGDELTKFRAEALSGDYYQLLATCMQWVNVT